MRLVSVWFFAYYDQCKKCRLSTKKQTNEQKNGIWRLNETLSSSAGVRAEENVTADTHATCHVQRQIWHNWKNNNPPPLPSLPPPTQKPQRCHLLLRTSIAPRLLLRMEASVAQLHRWGLPGEHSRLLLRRGVGRPGTRAHRAARLLGAR